MMLPASMFALDVLGGTIQATGLGFDEGDADRICLPLPGSLAPVPWLGEHVAQMQVAMYDHDRTPFFGDPRHVLEQVLGRFAARGLTPVMAVELEFYFVDRERTPAGARPAAAPAAARVGARTRRRSTRWQSSTSTPRCSPRSTRPRGRRTCRPARCSPSTARASSR